MHLSIINALTIKFNSRNDSLKKKSKVSVHTETMSLKTSGMQEVGYKQEVYYVIKEVLFKRNTL